ncbi:MAG TPA: tRNA pseudouridine(38-40) synthase TruA [Candidatus Hodarchaeales archaeon]|nr:tRNA pseudouridine(38-40) synthase TruA [Candidatus Hodarchaeales archaeon]
MFLLIKVAYIATEEYSGFQWQPNVPTIEGALRKALIKSEIGLKDPSALLEYSGRTDRGVHAHDQAIKIETTFPMVPNRPLQRINAFLPETVVTWAYCEVGKDFSPRRDANWRMYSYYFIDEDIDSLDFEKMRKGSDQLIGKHNFQNFAKMNPDTEDYEREVISIEMKRLEEEIGILFLVKGVSFLWQMVRRVLGHLVDLGTGNVSDSETGLLLTSRNVRKPQPLPPGGLILEEVKYQNLEWNFDKSINMKFMNRLDDRINTRIQEKNVLTRLRDLHAVF